MRIFKRGDLPRSSSGRLGKVDFLVVALLSESSKPVRGPEPLATVLGLSRRRVARAWRRLAADGLIVTAPDATPGDQPKWSASAQGKELVRDTLMSLEVSEFEPELLGSLRRWDLKAPFPPSDRMGGL